MKIVLAFDSFKNCLPNTEVCRLFGMGIHEAVPAAEVIMLPLSDGGEGFAAAALAGMPSGRAVMTEVTDSLGRVRQAEFTVGDSGAVVEVASACGIELLDKKELNPLHCTTFGVGTLLRAARRQNIGHLAVGLGGSATVDGGIGMLQALGVRFFDGDGHEIAPGAGGDGMCRTVDCDISGLVDFSGVKLVAASDVTNLLCGEKGAARVFGPQKGADAAMVEKLDAGLARYQRLLCGKFGKELSVPGDGAAGGLGFAMRMLGAEMCSGAELLLSMIDFDRHLAGACCMVTGEGCSDSQTICGKLPAVAAQHAKKHGVMPILVSGALAPDSECLADVFAATFSLSSGARSLDECMRETPVNLRRMGRGIANLLNKGGK